MYKRQALAYLMFNLFTPPCFAALGAMNSEMQDKKWLWGGIALQLGTGYKMCVRDSMEIARASGLVERMTKATVSYTHLPVENLCGIAACIMLLAYGYFLQKIEGQL